MNSTDLVLRRLAAQQLSRHPSTNPRELVAALGAVQAQDYPAAKWAIGLRIPGLNDAAVEDAVNRGEVLRTHVMRPTWHFVSPADIRWMLALTAPRVHQALTSNNHRLGLSAEIFAQTNPILEKTLAGGRQLTREELIVALEQNGIHVGPPPSAMHILLHAELDGIVCSGPRKGKHATYALLEERVPPTRRLSREEAVVELTWRYFTSHGPATLKDFAWWSGLTLADAKAGVEMNKDRLDCDTIQEKTYWFSAEAVATPQPGCLLLPNFDEYTVAYADRSAIFDPASIHKLGVRESVVMTNVMVKEGQVIGTWKRTITRQGVQITLAPFEPISAKLDQAFHEEACRYADFLKLALLT